MNDLVIYGAGWSDVVKIVAAINRLQPVWNLLGFLDDSPGRAGETFMGVPILGGQDQLQQLARPGVCFINNVASNTNNRAVVTALLERNGCEFASVIHPSVDTAFTEIGRGVLVGDSAVLGAGVVIGDHCVIRPRGAIGHEGVLGENVFVAPGATVCGFSRIAAGAYVGAGSTVKERVSLGANCVVGAGAVVVNDVPAETTVVGVPARPVSVSRGSRDVAHKDKRRI